MRTKTEIEIELSKAKIEFKKFYELYRKEDSIKERTQYWKNRAFEQIERINLLKWVLEREE